MNYCDLKEKTFSTSKSLPNIKNHEARGGALSLTQKMEIFSGFQGGIAEELGIHRISVCKTDPRRMG